MHEGVSAKRGKKYMYPSMILKLKEKGSMELQLMDYVNQVLKDLPVYYHQGSPSHLCRW